jgi:hypothetical protein
MNCPGIEHRSTWRKGIDCPSLVFGTRVPQNTVSAFVTNCGTVNKYTLKNTAKDCKLTPKHRFNFCPAFCLYKENFRASGIWQYLLTPWSKLLEKLTGLQLVKKLPAFY